MSSQEKKDPIKKSRLQIKLQTCFLHCKKKTCLCKISLKIDIAHIILPFAKIEMSNLIQ